MGVSHKRSTSVEYVAVKDTDHGAYEVNTKPVAVSVSPITEP